MVDDLGGVGEGRRVLLYSGACGPPALPRREKVPGVDPELLGACPSDVFRKIAHPLRQITPKSLERLLPPYCTAWPNVVLGVVVKSGRIQGLS